MKTKLIIILLINLNYLSIFSWPINVDDYSDYSATVSAGQALGGTKRATVEPHKRATLDLSLLNDSVYAEVNYVPKDKDGNPMKLNPITGRPMGNILLHTDKDYSSSGQRAYNDFILFGPILDKNIDPGLGYQKAHFYVARKVYCSSPGFCNNPK